MEEGSAKEKENNPVNTKSAESYFKWRVERANEFLNFAKKNADIKGKRVLDLGCGQGALSYLLAKECAEIYAVDIDAKSIAFLKNKMNDENISNVHVTEVAGEKLPFEDGFFDTVLCFDALEHMANPEVSLSEMTRCLKAGGEIIIEFTPYYSVIAGHHLYTLTLLPAQYLPKKLIKWHVLRKKPNKLIATWAEPAVIWANFVNLNKMTISRARKLFKKHRTDILEEKLIIKYPSLFTKKIIQRDISWLRHAGAVKEAATVSYMVALKKVK